VERTLGLRRLLGAPLWVHAVAVALVLVVLLPVVGTSGQFSADEGAAIAQAARLERGDGWTMTHSFPEADPTGDAFAFELSTRAGDEYAPFAKHPLYPVLLAAASRAGGKAAMILLSVAGTVLAALLSARLARRIDGRVAVATLWVVGLLSPLFFDSYVVIAHTLGAACAVGVVLAVLRIRDGRRAFVVVAFAASMVGALLRTEFLFLALAVTVAVLALDRSRASWAARVLALAPVIGAGAGYVVDALSTRAIMGGASATTAAVTATTGGVIGGRVLGFVITWLLPSYSLDASAALLLVAAVAVAVATSLARNKPEERDGVRLFAAVAALAGIARLVFGAGAVPGLLVAFPVLVVALVVIRAREVDDAVVRIVTATAVLFALAVIATQYASGGSGEWGGRYFALALPVIVPVALASARPVLGTLDQTTARFALGGLLVLSLALSTLAIVTLRDQHDETEAMAAQVDATARANPTVSGGLPVVLASDGGAARFAYEVVDRTRWLTVKDTDLSAYATRLRSLGVDRLTFVTRDEDDLRELTSTYRAESATHPAGKWIVYVLRAT
jgi:hypothetical protein